MTQGQQLAAIDTTDLDLARRQAKADRRQAAAELELRVAGPRKEDIAEASAQVKALESDLERSPEGSRAHAGAPRPRGRHGQGAR